MTGMSPWTVKSVSMLVTHDSTFILLTNSSISSLGAHLPVKPSSLWFLHLSILNRIFSYRIESKPPRKCMLLSFKKSWHMSEYPYHSVRFRDRFNGNSAPFRLMGLMKLLYLHCAACWYSYLNCSSGSAGCVQLVYFCT